MTRQSRKPSVSKVAQFELKRMEILRYHDAPITELRGSDTSMWLVLLLSLLLVPTTFIKKEDKPDKEE